MGLASRVVTVGALLALAACNNSSVEPQCQVDSDCGTTTACETVACTTGTCSTTFVAAGTPTPTQVQGDCKSDECDGSGNAIEVPDGSDLPSTNGNQCEIAACANGTPSLSFAQSGTACGTDLVCNDVGTCVGCVGPLECPGSDTQCEVRQCLNNSCGFAFTAVGVKLTTQTLGDCQDVVCNGDGGTESVADNNDTPKGSNACLEAVCTAGVPSTPPEPEGFPCGVGSDGCDGSGTCITLCGNGIIDNGEQCDGSALGGATCQGDGFQQGTVTCTAACTLDTSDCSTCGDGIVEGTEACDGSAFDGATCLSLGHPQGPLGCSADCSTIDTSGCGAFFSANTNFTGTVCTDGIRWDGDNELLAVCTVDQGIWRGTIEGAGPIDDPIWANADGNSAGNPGTFVSSQAGVGLAAFVVNGKLNFWTSNAAGSNMFGTNNGGFTSNPPTWTTSNSVSMPEQIFALVPGTSNNNFYGGFDPVTGAAIMLHGNVLPAHCATNGLLGCGFAVEFGPTGTVTSIATGQNNLNSMTFDIHVAVNGTQPGGAAGSGGGIYWTCDQGSTYVEDDNGIAVSDKPLVFKVLADQQTFVLQSTGRTCASNGNTIMTYAGTMYAALLGGGSLYKTVDGGATWALSNTGLPVNAQVFSIAIDCNNGGGAQSFECANDQLLYAATDSGVFESTNGGASWTLAGLSGSVVKSVAIEPQHPGGFFTATGATETGNTVTLTLSSGEVHLGDPIVVVGMDDAGYDGTFTVTSIISSTQFTVTNPTSGLAASGNGSFFLLTPRVFAATDQPNGLFQTNLPTIP